MNCVLVQESCRDGVCVACVCVHIRVYTCACMYACVCMHTVLPNTIHHGIHSPPHTHTHHPPTHSLTPPTTLSLLAHGQARSQSRKRQAQSTACRPARGILPRTAPHTQHPHPAPCSPRLAQTIARQTASLPPAPLTTRLAPFQSSLPVHPSRGTPGRTDHHNHTRHHRGRHSRRDPHPGAQSS